MRLLRLILGDPDPRSTREVERDIADELAAHVEMIEEELRETGATPERAKAEAARRFGDIEHYRRLCRRVTLKERLMLQRINLALLVVVMIALGVTAWQSWRGQARTAEAVVQLTKQLEAMNARTGATGAAAPSADAGGGVVIITGVIDREGQYLIPPGGLTLRRALLAAGWGGMRPIRVKLSREGESAAREFSWDQMKSDADMPLQNNDTVTVYTAVIDTPTQAGLNRRGPGDEAGVPEAPQGDVVVSGEGVRTGAHAIAEARTLLRALAAAGWDGKAPIDIEMHREGVPDIIGITWKQLQDGNDLALQAGDSVVVRTHAGAAQTVTVSGEVERPGSVPYRETMTLRSVLEDAGANLNTPADVRVKRVNEAREIVATTSRLLRGENWRLKPGDAVTVTKREAPKPDASGRLVEKSFSQRVVDRLAELRAECYSQYDGDCMLLGLSNLETRTDTVLIIGDVDRPGIYMLDAVKKASPTLPPTLADLAASAGARAGTNSVIIVPRTGALGDYGGERSFMAPGSHAAGNIVVVKRTDQVSDRDMLFVHKDGAWSGLAVAFAGAPLAEYDRWSRTVEQVLAINSELHDRAKVDASLYADAIDVYTTGGEWRVPIRFLSRYDGQNAPPVTLRALLEALGANRRLGARWVSFSSGAKPTELPLDDALHADTPLPPGSVVLIRAQPIAPDR